MQQPQALNREQRRKLEKAARRKPESRPRAKFKTADDAYAHLLKPLVLLEDCRPYEAREVAHDFLKIRAAYERLRDGGADKEDFRRVSVAMNLAKIRAMDIDEHLADEFEKAQDAMIACGARARKLGKYGFDGPGLLAMEWAIDAHEEVVSASSHKQMEMAMDVVREAVQKRTAYGAQIAELLL